VVAAIAAFFLGTAAFTYFFPAINARSYATGSARVQRIIINRGLSELGTRESFELLYVANKVPDSVQVVIEETMDTIIVSGEGEPEQYAIGAPPDYYQTVRSAIADVERAMKDKEYSIRHPQPQDKTAQVLILERRTDDAHTGYLLYFTEDHKIDTLHFFDQLAEDVYEERIYTGLTLGVPEFDEDLDSDDEDSDN
jgi:hypothetical protein